MAELGFDWSGSRARYAVLSCLPRKIGPVTHKGKLRFEATVAINGLARFMIVSSKSPASPSLDQRGHSSEPSSSLLVESPECLSTVESLRYPPGIR